MLVMWDEIGEAEDNRQGTLQLLEECLNVYQTKVEQVRHHQAQLKRDNIVDSVVEVVAICATIGEPPATVQTACSSLKVRY
jgi:Ase1/PRC1/MAP65 family protein